MANLDTLSTRTLVNSSGVPYAGAKAYYWSDVGATTPLNTYSDAGLSSANTNPVVADSNGTFGAIYLSAARYWRTVTDTSGNALTRYNSGPIDGSLQLVTSTAAPSPTYPFLSWYDTSTGNRKRRSSDNASWIDEGPVDSLISGATVTEQLAGTSASKASTPDSVAALWQRGVDIASATTISLPSGGGYEFNITGTTTITGISTSSGGRKVRFKFASALTLTHNASSFIMSGGSSVPVKAGDLAEFTNDAATDATGSNWRLTGYFYASVPISRSISFKTASYPVADSDNGTTIRFSALAADATLTLPAASGRNGFTLTVVNASVFADNATNATPFGVIVDPNASETIDGFTTRKTFAWSRVTFVCDGTGWYTVSGKWRFVSTHQVVTASSQVAVAHTLGVRPDMCGFYLQNTTAEAGYSQFDIVYNYPDNTDGGFSTGLVVIPDGTNLNYRVGTTAMWVMNKTTNAVVTMTATSWRAILWAEA